MTPIPCEHSSPRSCADCRRLRQNAKNRERYANSPEKREYAKKYREDNKEKAAEYLKNYRKLEHAKARKRELTKRYAEQLEYKIRHREKAARKKGVPWATGQLDKARTLLENAHVCDICARELSITWEVCLDHDHESGMLRGVLCHRCNRSLGLLQDSVDVLQSAINYLKRSR